MGLGLMLTHWVIPAPYLLQLSVYEYELNGMYVQRTYVEVRSDIWRGTMRWGTTDTELAPEVRHFPGQQTSSLGFFQTKDIQRLAENGAEVSQGEALSMACIPSDHLWGNIAYGNGTEEPINLDLMTEEGKELNRKLNQLIGRK